VDAVVVVPDFAQVADTWVSEDSRLSFFVSNNCGSLQMHPWVDLPMKMKTIW
jgi:hypothetical protein